VAVVYGGPSPEHDVSILTGLQACRALTDANRDPLSIYWTKLGAFVLVDPGLEASAFVDGAPRDGEPLTLHVGPEGGFAASGRLGRPRRLDIEVAVLCTHGGPGEDGSLQGVLDLAGIAYTGPSAHGAALGMDKLTFTATVAAHGVDVLPRVLLDAGTDAAAVGPAPYIVKPRFGGSSIGIVANVGDLATAKALLASNPHLAAGAVLEPYRPDLDDLQVAVRTYPALELSAIERPIRGADRGAILGYADKYVAGEGMSGAARELPASLSPDVVAAVQHAARTVARCCSVRGIARVDFLHRDGELYVNEVNTIPGSLSRHLFVEPARTFLELLDDLVAEASAVPTARYVSVGADGTVLRSAGAIAAKLA
jgi:D-alanine-D-alanine ligase